MKKIRLISALCALAMTATCFTACNTPASGTSSTPGTASGDASNVAPQKVENIVWYVAGNAPNKPDEVMKALNEKSAKDIGVTVDIKFQQADQEPIKNALAAGDSDIDIVFSCLWFADYRTSATNNYFYDITELLKEKTPELYETIPPALWEGMKVDGKIYGVPTWKDSADTQFWIGRTEILEKAGAAEDFAKTGVRLSTMTPVLEKIKDWHDADPANNQYTEGCTAPFVLDKSGDTSITIEWDRLLNDLEIGVKNFEDDNPTVQWMYDDADFVDDLKTLKLWADKGLSNGIAAAQIDSKATAAIGRSIGWDGAQYTVWGGEAMGYESTLQKSAGPLMKSTAALGSANCIPLNSKKVDAALKYLQYINTNAEYRNMLAYGIEGVNFEVVDGKYKSLTASDWITPNYTMASFHQLYAPEAVPNADMYKTICDGVFTAPENTLTGFAADFSKIQNEVAACNSIVKEHANALRRGDVKDVDAAIKDYKAKLEKLGLQTIITELQAQVDAFVAAKK